MALNPTVRQQPNKWVGRLILIAVGYLAGAWFVLWLASFGHVGESACGNLVHNNRLDNCSRSLQWTSAYGFAFVLFAVLIAALLIGIRRQSSWKRWPVVAMLFGDAFAVAGAVWLRSHGIDLATGLDLATSIQSSLSVSAMAQIGAALMLVTTAAAAAAIARSGDVASDGGGGRFEQSSPADPDPPIASSGSR